MTLIGIDVGGTTMKAAIVAGATTVAAESWTTDQNDPVGGILDFAARLAARAEELTGSPAAAAGIALPGIVDEPTGTAVHSANLGWRNVPILRLATERLGIPVAIGHDVRTGGLGEASLGAGRGADDFLFVAIGTGIAAALILRGTPYPGALGWSGEIGHIVVRPDGEPCACGNHGCLETYASAAAISRRHTLLAARAATPASSSPVPAEQVIALAASGDEHATTVWNEALDCLADGLASATLLLDPGLIVIGGGLAQAGAALLDPLASRLADRLTFRSPPPLLPSELGDQAGVRGATLLAARLPQD
ncbi:ROK family protein [Actinomadura rubrisoli]|uniref:ROK family protein n=1 Tax=Actinomadura rubrisoli TaxID=2530368 RepID=A0A4V2YT25_9ACTN|nr:ROK family protein [Actinomadura rubrisoli]TDD72187.1 ROK family protein [Actinomadura rubrisoli]